METPTPKKITLVEFQKALADLCSLATASDLNVKEVIGCLEFRKTVYFAVWYESFCKQRNKDKDGGDYRESFGA
jgi:hypothetical protein